MHLPLMILTNSKCIFDVITKSSTTCEMRLMAYISTGRNSFLAKEICDLGQGRNEFNPADVFTNMKQSEPTNKILQEKKCDLPIDQ